MSEIYLAKQVPSDFEIACDKAVDDKQRLEAWNRHEEEKWFNAVLDGLFVKNIDYFMMKRLRGRLIEAGRMLPAADDVIKPKKNKMIFDCGKSFL